MSLAERLRAELVQLYSQVRWEGGPPGDNPCGECKACCTGDVLTFHRVSEVELDLISHVHGEAVAGEFSRYAARERDASGALVHPVCPNYRGGCGIYAERPFSCRLFGHMREAGTAMPTGCVFTGYEHEFPRSEYFRVVPEAPRLRRLIREFRVLVPVTRGYVTGGGGEGELETDYLDPDDAQDRALLLQVRGQFEEALAELLAVRATEPSAYLEYSLGLVLGSLDRHVEAREAFLKAREEAPERADLPYYAGYHSLMLGEGERGRAYLEEAVALDPEHSLALGFLGYHYLNSGDRATARSYFERARAADPANPYFKARLESLQ